MNYIYDVDLRLDGKWGALPAIRPLETFNYSIEVPFGFDVLNSDVPNGRIAVFAHIFYVDLAAEILEMLGNIPQAFDLYISTDTTNKADELAHVFRGFPKGKLKIKVFENRGRDIAPFLVGFGRTVLKYDHVLHIHSKQSPHDSILNGWRQYSYRHLLGSEEIVGSILFALRTGEVDCLFPDHFAPVRQSLNFGYDYSLMKDLLLRMGIGLSKDLVLEFPSGSMFWANSKALKPLIDLGLKVADFPEELGQVDGTLAHAIERSLLYVVEHTGGRHARLGLEEGDRERHIKVRRPQDVGPAVTRVYRRLLTNRISIGHRIKYMDEICTVGLRPESSGRKRLTLLLPTLQPEKVFGGISSAIRLFRELAAALGEAFDYRIVSLNEPVDIRAMSVVSDFSLVPLGASNTELPKVVMDASGYKAEQLPVRQNEVFLATAWWTAELAFRMKDMQKSAFAVDTPIVYLIQDHEPDFYGWSSRYAAAQATYKRRDDTVAVINSEELTEFCLRRYEFRETFCMTYRVNATLRQHFSPRPKEKIILVYSRPSVARNAFETLMDGVAMWQQNEPMVARDWRIIALGEKFPLSQAPHVSNLEVLGKASLDEYADLLCRASVGISLMVSPHPSYPPLEMAEAGVYTITNRYEEKDLTLRSSNFANIDVLTSAELAAALQRGVEATHGRIGSVVDFSTINDIEIGAKRYDASSLASIIGRF